MQPEPKLKEGDDRHIKGFILNKLYLGGYFDKHTSIDNLPKGYAPEHRGKFKRITNELRKDGYIRVFPSAKEKHVCAVLGSETVERGLRICNAYREAVGLPPLDKRFQKILK